MQSSCGIHYGRFIKGTYPGIASRWGEQNRNKLARPISEHRQQYDIHTCWDCTSIVRRSKVYDDETCTKHRRTWPPEQS